MFESLLSRRTGQQAVSVSTSRLHGNTANYTGKDDPVVLMRVQRTVPATGEVLASYAMGLYVAGCIPAPTRCR